MCRTPQVVSLKILKDWLKSYLLMFQWLLNLLATHLMNNFVFLGIQRVWPLNFKNTSHVYARFPRRKPVHTPVSLSDSHETLVASSDLCSASDQFWESVVADSSAEERYVSPAKRKLLILTVKPAAATIYRATLISRAKTPRNHIVEVFLSP